jgi:hypothetical protein
MTTLAYHLKMPKTCRAGMMLFWKETARRKRLVFLMRFHPRPVVLYQIAQDYALKILVSVVQIRPRAPSFKTISMT